MARLHANGYPYGSSTLHNANYEYISIGDNLGKLKGDKFWFSLWFRTVEMSTAIQTILRKDKPSTPYNGYQFNLGGSGFAGRASFWFGNSKAGGTNMVRVATSSTDPLGIFYPNIWYHIILAYDGSAKAAGVKYWVNGTPVVTTIITDSMSQEVDATTNPLVIGSWTNFTEFFKGNICAVIHGTGDMTDPIAAGLYADQIPATAENMWRLDNITGTTAPDSIGSLSGTVAVGVDVSKIAPSRPRISREIINITNKTKTLCLAAAASSLSTAAPTAFAFAKANAFSVFARFYYDWALPQHSNGAATLFVKRDGLPDYNGFWCYASPDIERIGMVIYANFSTDWMMVVTPMHSLRRGVWNDIVVTYDGSGNRTGILFYINGVLQVQSFLGFASLTGESQPTTTNFVIGNTGAGSGLNGCVSDFAVLERAATLAEAQAFYLANSIPVDIASCYSSDNFTTPTLTDSCGVVNLTASGVTENTTNLPFPARAAASNRQIMRSYTGSYLFDGLSGSAIRVPYGFDVSAKSWSMMGMYYLTNVIHYVNTTGALTDQVFFSQTDGTGTGRSILAVLIQSGGARIGTETLGGSLGGTIFASTCEPRNGAWIWVGVTYDLPTTTLKIYCNGVLSDERVIVPEAVDGDFVLGAAKGEAVGNFNGNIGEFVGYEGTVLSAAQMLEYYVSGAKPAGAFVNYPFTDGAGTTVTDISGNARHGSIVGGGAWSTGVPF